MFGTSFRLSGESSAQPVQPQAATWCRAASTVDGVAGNLRRDRRRTMRSPGMDAFPWLIASPHGPPKHLRATLKTFSCCGIENFRSAAKACSNCVTPVYPGNAPPGGGSVITSNPIQTPVRAGRAQIARLQRVGIIRRHLSQKDFSHIL